MGNDPGEVAASQAGRRFVSDPVAQGLLDYVQIAYPLILLFLYLVAFTVRSIATARTDADADGAQQQPKQLGPNGKPLPERQTRKDDDLQNAALDFSKPRKLLFQWLTVGVVFTLLANIVVILVHALYSRKDGWWCGVPPTVGRALILYSA